MQSVGQGIDDGILFIYPEIHNLEQGQGFRYKIAGTGSDLSCGIPSWKIVGKHACNISYALLELSDQFTRLLIITSQKFRIQVYVFLIQVLIKHILQFYQQGMDI